MWQHDTGDGVFTDDALAENIRCFTPETIHASCEDYRAAASIDLEHDEADITSPVTCPVLVLWGAKGAMERHYDVLPKLANPGAGCFRPSPGMQTFHGRGSPGANFGGAETVSGGVASTINVDSTRN